MAILTRREKELEHAIDHCGIPLDKFSNTDTCIRDVMRRIGASPSDYDFVRARVAVRVKTAAAIARADGLISGTEKMLSQFEQDDKEWERKGRELGFKF